MAAPADPANEGTPGEYLASNFALVNAADALADDTAPGTFVNNPDTNPALQAIGSLPTEVIEASYGGDHGRTPNRDSTAIYTDGQSAAYVANDGTTIGYGSTLVAGTAVGDANAIAGDFNGDLVRDTGDIAAMVAAVEAAQGGSRSSLTVAKQSLELMGDFNNDGNFDLDDVRYGADGLFSRGRAGDTLDRAANFIEVDAASASGNLFGTTLATGKAYAAGDSRADIAGSGFVSAGANPNGADGVVNAADIDSVYANFNGLDRDDSGSVEWSNLDEIAGATLVTGQRVDLSADMNGDLAIGQSDVDTVVRGVLGTEYGDANLDRRVTASGDGSLLLGNLGQSDTGPGDDFDGSGR